MSYERLSSPLLSSPTLSRQKSSALFLLPQPSLDVDSRSYMVINPNSVWRVRYTIWFRCACMGALITAMMEPLSIAFGLQSSLLDYTLLVFFAIDILVSSRLAFNDESHLALVTDPDRIHSRYFSFFARLGLFWWDLLALIPWAPLALLTLGEHQLMGGDQGTTSSLVLAVNLLRLVKMIRCYRITTALEYQIEHHAHQLIWILARNLVYLALVLHLSACSFWFIARYEGFSEDSWVSQLSPSLHLNVDPLKAYVMSLYFVTATFATVGFGDIRPSTSAEVVFVTFFIFINVAMSAYVIGTITLVVVRSDQLKTSHRSRLNVLTKFCKAHKVPLILQEAIGEHIEHASRTEETSDEQIILSTLPTSLKLKVLRFLHLPQLQRCYLFKGCSSKTLDGILAASRVETYLPATEVVNANESVPDLFVVLKGLVDGPDSQYGPGESFAESSFFTHSNSEEPFVAHPNGVTRLLLVSQSAFESVIGEKDAQVIYQNLLQRCEDRVRRSGGSPVTSPTRQPSAFNYSRDQQSVVEAMRARTLVGHHLRTLNHARVYKFLSAASRGDEATLSNMIQQGMDVNSIDYDARSALMLAASKGHVQCLQLLLQSGANPSLVDAGGCSALMEACKQGSSQACDLLMSHGARLSGIDPSVLAGCLCRAVSDCDGRLLTRLIQAGADCGAADYDSRTALHIAASDGNLAMAGKLLEGGAPLAAEDRFGFTPLDEARRAGAGPLVEFLAQRVTDSEAKLSLDKFLLSQTTAMMHACSSGDLPAVKQLLEIKACPVDVVDYDGRTGLHLAAARGHEEVCRLLIKWGADGRRADHFMHRAVDEAKRHGHSAIEAFLSSS